MKVSDVMAKQVDFVTTDTKVKDVCQLIFGRGINGVPVVKEKKVIGFITERDILAKFYPSMQEYMEDSVHASDFEGMEEKVSEIMALTAQDVMNKNPKTVKANMPLLHAHSIMSVHRVGRLPVVDGKGKLIGIISRGDVFRTAVGDKLELAEDEEYNDWLSKRYYLTVDWRQRMSLEIPDLISVFRKNNVEKILDVGCATGQHVIELAKNGYSATGIERSRIMIRDALATRKTLSDELKKRTRFLYGEYEKVVRTLKKEKFDAVLFMGNTISHNPYNFEDVIRVTAKILSKRGVMIFQITNFEKVLAAQKRLLNFSFINSKYAASPYQEHLFLEYYNPPSKRENTILKTFGIFDFDGKRWKFYGLRNALFAHVTKRKIEKVLRAYGFKDLSFYGSSFDGVHWDRLFQKPFKPLESDWLNVVAKRG